MKSRPPWAWLDFERDLVTGESKMVEIRPADAAALLEYGTATLHEAAGVGEVLPAEIRPMVAGAELCGPAFTVETGAGHNVWIHRAVYEAPAGSVLVISCGGGYEFGYWGEVLSTAASERGLAGVVIDGYVRDSLALARVGFPVFARGLCVRGTGKQAGAGRGLGGLVRLGDSAVSPGDLVLGDADGVIALPFSAYDGLLGRASERTTKEQRVMDALRRGGRTTELLGLEARG